MKGQDYQQLTLFPAGSPASLLALPGSEEAKKMTVSSGRKWLELSKKSGRLGLLEKMLLESSGWSSKIFYLNWKPVGMPQGHFLFQLVLSEPDTEDTGLRLWATPNTMDYLPQRSPEALKRQAEGSRKGRKRPANLREQVNEETVKMWPTPTASDYKKRGPNSKQQGLPEKVKMYSTPTAQDAQNSTLPKSQIKRGTLVGDIMREMFPTPTTGAGMCGGTGNYKQLKKLEENGTITEEERKNMSQGNGGKLNPDWVEWLMGFPIGWTKTD